MSWMQKLYRTYEFSQNKGLDDEDLALPFHMLKSVHLRITLNEKSEFVKAELFGKKKQVAIQVTEKSSKRSGSTIAPYALHDSLQYIAKSAEDYMTVEYLLGVAKKESGKKWKQFLTDSNEGRENFSNSEKEKLRECFHFYEKQLLDWVGFSDLLELKILLKYIQKGSLIEDLIDNKYFSFENGILLSEQDDPFSFTVVWSIELPNDPHTDLWNKPNIQQAWIEYQESMFEQGGNYQDLCYVTGELGFLVEAYPKIDGNAKLVSANDSNGFTFRGRFLADREAVSLGREVSQKAFNALKWLIKKQGIRNGKQVIVAWAIGGQKIPLPLQEFADELEMLDETTDIPYLSDDDNKIAMPLPAENSIDHSEDLGKKAFELIKKKYQGYKANLKSHEQISLLMLDSASDGRMALTYYQEFLPDDYFANLDAWIDDFSWYQRHSIESKDGKKNDKRTIWAIMPPSPFAIANAVYGKSLSDTLKKQLYARLLPVIAGGNGINIPYDLVQKSFQMACSPYASYNPKEGEEARYEKWLNSVGVACALYVGFCSRKLKRRYSMSLDVENRSRDYLYGRLIAVAEALEWYAMYLQNGKKPPSRATNAERYFQRFARYPYSTWRQLEVDHLKNYQTYLTGLGKYFYQQKIGEIMQLFDPKDYVDDSALSGEFLLGYHCQKMHITEQIAQLSAKKSTEQTQS